MLEIPVLLLLDDQFHVLATRGCLFGHYGYRVVLASNASEAMDVLDDLPVGVLIVDYRILDMHDGLVTLKRISHLYPETGIIMLNEGNNVENINQILKENVIDHYFENPLVDHQFKDCINKLFKTYSFRAAD